MTKNISAIPTTKTLNHIQSYETGLSLYKALIAPHTKRNVQIRKIKKKVNYKQNKSNICENQSIFIFLWQLLNNRKTWWEI